ncbi:type II toxin-antitoxin system RelB/DinJ family antitoxin [Dialister micraerophilus]|uniref:Addiction module antitoxin, RelB/DinJ family n=1 Tax=Dialister micraerophilus UPII 345-E TaxID=910314 RepID=E4L8Z8_9FIRM|nr:type II toxin-antitoxin system RelB/DinJ family antitoxin [Dialister micraerophilus]EFR42752.1 addiction module antitoxin, RelB/DinJ family [Dialister micraerophilus UPII 345-E]
MEQATINFRIDKNIKKNMEKACKNMGLTMTAAFTLFAVKVARENRIPFMIEADPFYNEKNMKRLKKSIEQLENGKGTIHEVEFYD